MFHQISAVLTDPCYRKLLFEDSTPNADSAPLSITITILQSILHLLDVVGVLMFKYFVGFVYSDQYLATLLTIALHEPKMNLFWRHLTRFCYCLPKAFQTFLVPKSLRLVPHHRIHSRLC